MVLNHRGKNPNTPWIELWGTSVGGVETLKSCQICPRRVFPSQVTDFGVERITIGFEKGEPVSLNNETMTPVGLIRKLHQKASRFGVEAIYMWATPLLAQKGVWHLKLRLH